MMNSRERAEFLVKKRGYIVLCSHNPVSIGYVQGGTLLRGSFGQPFVVVAETTQEDCLEQYKLLQEEGDFVSVPTGLVGEVRDDLYYYRLTTD